MSQFLRFTNTPNDSRRHFCVSASICATIWMYRWNLSAAVSGSMIRHSELLPVLSWIIQFVSFPGCNFFWAQPSSLVVILGILPRKLLWISNVMVGVCIQVDVCGPINYSASSHQAGEGKVNNTSRVIRLEGRKVSSVFGTVRGRPRMSIVLTFYLFCRTPTL